MSIPVRCRIHCHSSWVLSGGRLGRLAQQLATLAQGARLAPVGQEAHMPQALEAVGHNMQQKAPDTLMGLQRHGLHLIALAPMAIGEADRGRHAHRRRR